jgi:hypothetical protein
MISLKPNYAMTISIFLSSQTNGFQKRLITADLFFSYIHYTSQKLNEEELPETFPFSWFASGF